MPGGHVDRGVLSSNYQQPGDIYDDKKTESAFEVLAQQIDDNAAIFDPGGSSLIPSAPLPGLVGVNIYAQLSDLLSKVLTLANTNPYTPTADYHPATLRYVLDAINAAITSGSSTAIIKTGTSFPATPTSGQMFFKTDENRLYVYAGSIWVGFAKKQQENWIAPTLLNGWINFGSPQSTAAYYKDDFGIVHLKGVLKSGSIGFSLFNLPVGYRPSEYINFAVISNNAIGKVAITPTGDVNSSVGSNANFPIDGIAFRSEQ